MRVAGTQIRELMLHPFDGCPRLPSFLLVVHGDLGSGAHASVGGDGPLHVADRRRRVDQARRLALEHRPPLEHLVVGRVDPHQGRHGANDLGAHAADLRPASVGARVHRGEQPLHRRVALAQPASGVAHRLEPREERDELLVGVGEAAAREIDPRV